MNNPITPISEDSKHHPVALILKGICMGIADVIPGVSGGTIAFLLNIYEDWINAIRSVDLQFLKYLLKLDFISAFEHVEWKFLASLLSGIVISIVVFAKLIGWLFVHYPVYLNSFFFGLIVMTVYIVGSIIKRWNIKTFSIFVLATIVTFLIVRLVPIQTPDDWWFVFLSGAIAISAMILPGISGSFILLILGKYEFILNAVNNHDIGTIFIFVCGIAFGVLTFVRVLSWLFRKHHDVTVATITGVILGSLYKIWPWTKVLESLQLSEDKIIVIREQIYFPLHLEVQTFVAFGIMAIGCVLAYNLHRSSKPDQFNFF